MSENNITIADVHEIMAMELDTLRNKLNELIEKLENDLVKAQEEAKKARGVKWFYENGFKDGEAHTLQKVIAMLREIKE
jgi:flagellar biosynthesis/type III secretory pathway protein FliH